MSNKKDLSEEEKTILKDLVDKNYNALKIKKHLNNKYSYTTIRNKIKSLYKKEWNKEKQIYENLPASNQLNFLDDTYSTNQSIDNSHKTTNGKENAEKAEKTIDSLSFYQRIINDLITINNNINKLNTRLNKIENLLSVNPPQKKKELVQSFINIFSSNKDRESVNINPEIKSRVIEKMKKTRDIKKNQSHAINTALLIALFSDDDNEDQQ